MVLTQRFSRLLLILSLFVWAKPCQLLASPNEPIYPNQAALNGAKLELINVSGKLARWRPTDLTHLKRQLRPLRLRSDDNLDDDADRNGDDEDEEQRWHRVNIQTTNVEERENDRDVEQALIQMMKLKNKVANRHPDRFDNVPGLDLKREFASDEANPYV